MSIFFGSSHQRGTHSPQEPERRIQRRYALMWWPLMTWCGDHWWHVLMICWSDALITGFKERWFKLRGNLLFYYRVNEFGGVYHKEPVGCLVIELCRIQREDQSGLGFAFSICKTVRHPLILWFSLWWFVWRQALTAIWIKSISWCAVTKDNVMNGCMCWVNAVIRTKRTNSWTSRIKSWISPELIRWPHIHIKPNNQTVVLLLFSIFIL